MEKELKKDLWGCEVHTTSDPCIQYINSHYLQVLSYGSNQKIIHKAMEDDSRCALALALSAVHSFKSNSDNASSFLAAAKSSMDHATQYEKMVITAAEALIEGKYDDAIEAYSKVLQHYPKDLVSLKRVQVLCFYLGKSEESLKLALKILPFNKEAPYMYGMLAFALLETHHFSEADEAARRALSIEKTDQWAQHALCHVFQYKCLFQDAILFMEKNKESWNDCCSFMYSHNWWHLALCYLEWGSDQALQKVIEIYDSHIWPTRHRDSSGGVQVSLNALGLLLRLELRGYADSVHTRILSVAEQLYDTGVWHKERLLDVLAVWGLTYAGQPNRACSLLKALKDVVHSSQDKTKQKSLGSFLQLAEGLHQYGLGNFNEAFDALGPAFTIRSLKVIGASDEQLDVFEEFWCVVCLRSGHFKEASKVLNQRTKTFNGSAFTWQLMENLSWNMGLPSEAENAANKANCLRNQYIKFISMS